MFEDILINLALSKWLILKVLLNILFMVLINRRIIGIWASLETSS